MLQQSLTNQVGYTKEYAHKLLSSAKKDKFRYKFPKEMPKDPREILLVPMEDLFDDEVYKNS